jgi:hypothetical protein
MVQAEASALAAEICDKVFNNASGDAKTTHNVPLIQTLFFLLAIATVERQILATTSWPSCDMQFLNSNSAVSAPR